MQLSLIYFDFKIGNTLKAKSNALKILKNCVCATDQSNVFSEIGVGKYILVFVIIIWKKKKKNEGEIQITTIISKNCREISIFMVGIGMRQE